MSAQKYHWEALRKQRVIDKQFAARQRKLQKQSMEENESASDAAREKLQSQQLDHQRRKQLAEEVMHRDRQGIQNSYKEREERIRRLVSEREWHDELIAKMNQEEKDELLRDLLRDHAQKSKVLRNHGLYRGPAKFFIDPEYD